LVPRVTVNSQGAVTFADTVPITGAGASGVTPGTYGSSTSVPRVTVNSQGVVTFADTVPITGGGGGGGGASQSADLIDCKVTVSGATATISTPCQLTIGSVVHSLALNATATLSGTNSTGTVYFYWSYNGNLTAD